MRIATANAADRALTLLQRRQEQLTEAHEQVTSGKRVRRASDDPGATARAERAMVSLSRQEADARALEASRTAMQMAELVLGQSGEAMQQVREQIVSAGNGSYTDSERLTIARTIRSLRGELLALANRDDAGRFVFGGLGADRPPLVDGPGGVTYAGTAGDLYNAAAEPGPLALDGEATWLTVPDPANPGGTLSVFGVLDRIATDLETPGRTAAQIATTVSEGLRDVDTLGDHLTRHRAATGEWLRRFDGQTTRIEQGKLDAQNERSQAEDVDMIEAVSTFQTRQSGYDAALKAYSSVQRLSLFEYLR